MGMSEPRCGFQTGWRSGAGREGVCRRLDVAEVKASGEVVIRDVLLWSADQTFLT
ncbi:hypothetical protein GCM10009610_48630 [Pseudonocardia xinjiangensis]